MKKIEVLKEWSKDYDLKLFHKVVGGESVEIQDDREVLGETRLSYWVHS